MNWTIIIVCSYIAMGLELALAPALSLGRADAGIVPGFVIPFVVFITMHAQPLPALWFALAMGAAVDLLAPAARTAGTGTVVSLGPHALAYLVMAYVILQVRTTVVRRNPLSLVALSILGAALASLVYVFVISFRSLYTEPTGASMLADLMRRWTSALYTGAAAAVVAWPLTRYARVFGFQDPNARRFSRRS